MLARLRAAIANVLPWNRWHFYSPTVRRVDVIGREQQLWPETPNCVGIDFNDDMHTYVLESLFPKYLPDYDYAETPPDAAGKAARQTSAFFTKNSQFSWLDSRALFVLLRHFQPRRIIEVGSGYSTLLMSDVNCRFLGGHTHITAIEPFPRPFLRSGLPGLGRLIESKVQDVPLDVFEDLETGDVLFIDSRMCQRLEAT